MLRAVVSFLQDTSRSRLRYILLAWPVATLPALVIVAVVLLSDAALQWGTPRNALEVTPGMQVAALLLAPALETAIMIVAYYALGLVIWRSGRLRVAVLALLSALAHLAAGGWLHVIGVLWVFGVLSVALAAWQARRTRDAFVVVTSIHLLHNATIVALQTLSS